MKLNVIFRLLNSSLGLDVNYTFRPTDTLAAFSAAYTGSYIGVLTTLEFILEQFNDILERYAFCALLEVS